MRRCLWLSLTLVACSPAPQSGPTPAPYPSNTPAGNAAPAAAADRRDETPVERPAAQAGKAQAPKAFQTILATHNRLRAEHCAPPLAWSAVLARAAQDWADALAARGCAFDHNPNTTYGENLAFFMPVGSKSPEQIAQLWYREIEVYNWRRPGFSFEAGHFTQLVWRSSNQMGCGTATCNGGELWVCNYNPPGNVTDAFAANVLPTSCK